MKDKKSTSVRLFGVEFSTDDPLPSGCNEVLPLSPIPNPLFLGPGLRGFIPGEYDEEPDDVDTMPRGPLIDWLFSHYADTPFRLYVGLGFDGCAGDNGGLMVWWTKTSRIPTLYSGSTWEMSVWNSQGASYRPRDGFTAYWLPPAGGRINARSVFNTPDILPRTLRVVTSTELKALRH